MYPLIIILSKHDNGPLFLAEYWSGILHIEHFLLLIYLAYVQFSTIIKRISSIFVLAEVGGMGYEL